MSYTKIKDIKVCLWNKYNVNMNANEDVNIIVGINGSGKTTLLNEIYKLALDNLEDKNQVVFVPSIDNIALRDKRKVSNALTQDLEFYMFDMKTGPSMMYYRMSMIDASTEKQVEMKARIEKFCSYSGASWNNMRIMACKSAVSAFSQNGSLLWEFFGVVE